MDDPGVTVISVAPPGCIPGSGGRVVHASCSRASPARGAVNQPIGVVLSMDIRACVAVRFRPGAGTRVVVYVITVTVVIALVAAGSTLPAVIAAVAGAGWAVGFAPRSAPAVAAG